MGIKRESAEDQAAINNACARFAASAAARMARELHEKGILDEYFMGELAASADESAKEQNNNKARWAMNVVRAQLGQPSPDEDRRQTALDAEDADND